MSIRAGWVITISEECFSRRPRPGSQAVFSFFEGRDLRTQTLTCEQATCRNPACVAFHFVGLEDVPDGHPLIQVLR